MAAGTVKDSKDDAADLVEKARAAANGLSPTAMVAELVASGVSRLTAERTVAIEQGEAEPGRARRRSTARH